MRNLPRCFTVWLEEPRAGDQGGTACPAPPGAACIAW
jgi:hypothetical protein